MVAKAVKDVWMGRALSCYKDRVKVVELEGAADVGV